MSRTCSTCPTALGAKNQSGYCRPCLAQRLNTDPEITARRRAGIARCFADPAYRQAHAERCAERNRNISDKVRASRRAHGLRKAARLLEASRAMTPEARARAGRARSETVLAWCPAEWRDRYRELKKRGRPAAEAKRIVLDLMAGRPGPVLYAQQKAKLAWCPAEMQAEYRRLQKSLGSAEARRVLEEQIARDERKRLAAMTPFERQLDYVRRGGKLVAALNLRRPDLHYTPGGVASGML